MGWVGAALSLLTLLTRAAPSLLFPSNNKHTTVTNPRIREARTAMVTAVAAALARRGVLFTLPPTAPAGGGGSGGSGGGSPDDDNDGGGVGDACAHSAADAEDADRRAVLMFAGGRGGRA